MGLIIGILIGVFFYGESISLVKGVACAAILLAVTLIEKSIKIEKTPISKGLVYSILSRLFWSTGLLFVPFIEKIGILLFCSILEAVVFSMSLILFLFQKDKSWKEMDTKTRNEIFFLIILGTTGTFCLNFAITKTSIIVFAFMGLIRAYYRDISFYILPQRENKQAAVCRTCFGAGFFFCAFLFIVYLCQI